MSKHKPKKSPESEDLTEWKLNNLIFIALGEVSMCWDPRPTGIFQGSKAKLVGDKLREDIKDLIRNI